MPVRIGAGLSTLPVTAAATLEAAAAAADGLAGAACDAAVVFVSGAHLAEPELVLDVVHEQLAPGALIGCGAQGVLAAGREVERGTGVAIWAASLGTGQATPFHALVEAAEEGAVAGLPDLEGASGAVLLADPYTFPAEPLLEVLGGLVPDVPLLGGVASARLTEHGAALFVGDEIVDSGAVGLRFDGVELAPCVSQGAAPVGPELTITAAEGNMILELAGRPAYEKLRDVVEGLGPEDTAALAAAGGILLGLVVDPNKPDYVQGDFLVRPVVGADPSTGALAVGALVRVGQVVRVHLRDAASAHRDLRDALDARTRELKSSPAGALLFSCNGRGRSMFGVAGHDAAAVDAALAGKASAGFFAAGEIGPVAGAPHLHGFTATVALFGCG